ncbi:MAG: serine/threonine-protein kinase, partial [Polyangia bacterium]
LNEARAANAIRHPNIIEILDSGTTDDGTPYLVMELLEGEVLSGRIRRLGRLPVADAMEFSYQVASALAAAHEKGIIHRDLKPDNLFIVADPSDASRERIKVLDFGIAKLQAYPTGGGMQTRTGTLMGTPVYMSPEQCLGTKTVDARSDIYALGIIIYEMLAGAPPFLSEGFGELVNMHLNTRPLPLRQLDPTIPQGLSDAVAKALEKSPEARQRSAAELQLELRAAAGRAIVIRGTSSPDIGATVPAGSPAPAGRGARAFAGATTLSTGTGERYSVTAPVIRSSGRRRLLFGAIAVVGLGAAVVAGLRRVDPAPGQPSGPAAGTAGAAAAGPPPEATPALVRLTIDSRPPGAQIVDVDSGQALGTTPAVVTRSASERSTTLRLEKAGFTPVTRTFPLDKDRTELVALEAAAAGVSSGPAAAAPGTRPPTKTPPPRPKRPVRPKHAPAAPPPRPDDEPAKL